MSDSILEPSILEKMKEDKAVLDERIDFENQSELDEKLNAAIRMGIEQGKRRSVGYRSKRATWQTGIAAITMLLMLTAFVRISPSFAAFIKEIPGFSRFVELVSYDHSLMTALNNEHMQIVNKSDERNGYKLTVNGVLADSQRIILLYTAEGPGITEEQSTFLPYHLSNENGDEIGAMIASGHYFREATGKEGIVQDYFDIQMIPEKTIPQQINVKMQLGEEWLEVAVPIDRQRFLGLEDIIELNQTIELAGQRMFIKRAIITPLRATIEIENDPANTKRIHDFIDLELVDNKGNSYRSASGLASTDNRMLKHFQFSSFDKPKSLTLKAKGVLLSDKGMKVVIDTEKEAMLSAPDDNLKLASVSRTGNYIGMKFELVQEVPRGYLLFRDDDFHDASGMEHSLYKGETGNTIQSVLRVSGPITGVYSLYIPNEDYVQPLTFDVYEYNGQFKQDISVKIK